MKRSAVVLTLLFALLLIGAQAQAVVIEEVGDSMTLGELEDSQGLIVGDKWFYDFEFTPSAEGTDAMAPGAGIVVTPILWDGMEGLRFNGGWIAGTDKIVDTTIRFKVQVLPEFAEKLWRISDALLFLSAGGYGGTGTANITETVYGLDEQGNWNPSDRLANLFVQSDAGFTQWQDIDLLRDEQGIPQLVTGVQVIKDVGASGGVDGGAQISEFYQVFSQTLLPEPASMSILVLGAGLLLRRRR